jgi:hypothetical protein
VERAVAASGGEVEVLDAREVVRGIAPAGVRSGPWDTLHRDVQWWTHAHHTDSMYVALLRRRAGQQ